MAARTGEAHGRRLNTVLRDGEQVTTLELDAWLAPYRQLWEERLDALERHLDEMEE